MSNPCIVWQGPVLSSFSVYQTFCGFRKDHKILSTLGHKTQQLFNKIKHKNISLNTATGLLLEKHVFPHAVSPSARNYQFWLLPPKSLFCSDWFPD